MSKQSEKVHIHIRIDKDVDDELRSRIRRRGDLSREVNDALRTVYLMKAPKKKD